MPMQQRHLHRLWKPLSRSIEPPVVILGIFTFHPFAFIPQSTWQQASMSAVVRQHEHAAMKTAARPPLILTVKCLLRHKSSLILKRTRITFRQVRFCNSVSSPCSCGFAVDIYKWLSCLARRRLSNSSRLALKYRIGGFHASAYTLLYIQHWPT